MRYCSQIVGLLLFLLISSKTYTQELNCNLQVVAPTVESTEKRIYETLQEAAFEFMNSRRWTNYTYNMEERIECSILINIKKKVSSDKYEGSIQVQSRRPIYKSAYNSPILNIKDNNFEFEYVEHQALKFNQNTFESNLTSILAYYAYLIIGMDFDTFSLQGGTPFYNAAQTIVNNAQNSSFTGWKAFESQKNRYWIVENLLNNKYSNLRQALYKYHREGLDVMHESTDEGRQAVTGALELLKKVHREKPGSYLMQIFFDAKADEIVNVYSESSSMEISRVKNILNEINPSNADKYNNIGKQ